ncbi:YbhB/YbcL family Raf kinase inhibitor-like protein [Sulfuriflexus sp.]|uniref:YbhB/YbcL family Raf kinase inhibitor-like protein n=1 Tax=Sulfuriflexus sp. TaxID=2015443 RepID=UPI0028CEBCAB|nr:YbhB/YbcL family Raf kinase inhibitor-like protein [Sulfuriflexus sp.]MDT8405461.1 YbhB/YbcL family Raf kinase inhibitor-like protein [Sulfuriflexus sp.]
MNILSLSLTSNAFEHNGHIPSRYTCDGEDISPPLAWQHVPADAESLVLIVDDPDAPDPAAPKVTWVHWLLYNIPASCPVLEEALSAEDLPGNAHQGRNDWKRTAYGGPCPPTGRHRYFFKLYALDTRLPDLHEPTKAKLEKNMQGHVLAQAELIGTYQC